MASGQGGARDSTPASPQPWDNSNKEFPWRADEDYKLIPAPLSQDLIAALRAQGGLELEVIDPETLREYVVVDAGLHREAMEALRRQANLEAIARGFAELQAGHGMELSVTGDSIRETLGLRARSS